MINNIKVPICEAYPSNSFSAIQMPRDTETKGVSTEEISFYNQTLEGQLVILSTNQNQPLGQLLGQGRLCNPRGQPSTTPACKQPKKDRTKIYFTFTTAVP